MLWIKLGKNLKLIYILCEIQCERSSVPRMRSIDVIVTSWQSCKPSFCALNKWAQNIRTSYKTFLMYNKLLLQMHLEFDYKMLQNYFIQLFINSEIIFDDHFLEQSKHRPSFLKLSWIDRHQTPPFIFQIWISSKDFTL